MTYNPVQPYNPDQPYASRDVPRRKWGWYLLLSILAFLIWRFAVARDVLIVNRYPQQISVRVADIPCDETIPAKSHRFAVLPFFFPSQSVLVAIYGKDGALLKSQTVNLTREQNRYGNLLIIDLKP